MLRFFSLTDQVHRFLKGRHSVQHHILQIRPVHLIADDQNLALQHGPGVHKRLVISHVKALFPETLDHFPGFLCLLQPGAEQSLADSLVRFGTEDEGAALLFGEYLAHRKGLLGLVQILVPGRSAGAYDHHLGQTVHFHGVGPAANLHSGLVGLLQITRHAGDVLLVSVLHQIGDKADLVILAASSAA